MVSHNTPSEKENGVDLDELTTSTQKLNSLLADKQPGLITWNEALSRAMKNVKRLIEQAGI